MPPSVGWLFCASALSPNLCDHDLVHGLRLLAAAGATLVPFVERPTEDHGSSFWNL